MRYREQRRLNQVIPAGFRLIPAGTFLMGASTDDIKAWDDEKPAHLVTLTERFWMKQTEVTQVEWEWVMGNNPSYFKGDQYLPVERVSWFDAVAYCNVLSEIEGIEPAYSFSGVIGRPGKQDFSIKEVEWDRESSGYRLPTEAEWEYACRARTTTPRYGELDDIAWYWGNSGRRTHPVGEKQPNRFGLYDMLGNVLEWCWDWFGEYSPGEQTNPITTPTGTYRVVRGGSWYNIAYLCRASDRNYNDPANRNYFLGFRPCRFLLPSEILPFDHWQKETEEVMFENPADLLVRIAHVGGTPADSMLSTYNDLLAAFLSRYDSELLEQIIVEGKNDDYVDLSLGRDFLEETSTYDIVMLESIYNEPYFSRGRFAKSPRHGRQAWIQRLLMTGAKYIIAFGDQEGTTELSYRVLGELPGYDVLPFLQGMVFWVRRN